MLRLLLIVSGGFEALFGLSTLVAPDLLIGSLGAEPNASTNFLARVFGAATLGLGIAALLARDQTQTSGGLAAACGLTLYNLLAGRRSLAAPRYGPREASMPRSARCSCSP